MSAPFVVDCSVAMTWLFRDEATPHTTSLLHRLETEIAVVPALWHLEAANVMAIAERQRRITADDSAAFIREIAKLNIEVDQQATTITFDQILPLCRAHQLTSYDAIYLELADRRKLPLATLDGPLRKAAKKLGIKLLGK